MYNKNLNKMNKETLRMQMLAGIITESQYKSQLNELAAPPQNWMEIAKPYFNNAELSVIENPSITFRPKADVGEKGPQLGYTFGFGDKASGANIIFYPYANTQEKKFQIRLNKMDKAKAAELAKKLAPEIIKAVSTSLLKDPSAYTSGAGYEKSATPEEAKQAIEFFTAALQGEPKEI